MKKLINISVLFMAALISANSWAVGLVQNTKITQIYCGYFNDSNMCSIYFDKEIDDSPFCHKANRQRMQIKTDDETGKAILSLALTAYAMQKPVDIRGKGKCLVWHDTEDMNMLHMK